MIPTMMAALSSSTITPQTQTFTTVGSFTFNVPAHVNGSLTVELFGAGGGGANSGTGSVGGTTKVDSAGYGVIGQTTGGTGGDATTGTPGSAGGILVGVNFSAQNQSIGSGSAGGGGNANGGNGSYLMINIDSPGIINVGDLLGIDVGNGGASDGGGGGAGLPGRIVFAWNTES